MLPSRTATAICSQTRAYSDTTDQVAVVPAGLGRQTRRREPDNTGWPYLIVALVFDQREFGGMRWVR